MGLEQWTTSCRVAVFMSMKDEIQTNDILRACLNSQKICFIPRYDDKTMDMVRVHSIEDAEQLPETAWKIKQPAADDKTRENALETGIVWFRLF